MFKALYIPPKKMLFKILLFLRINQILIKRVTIISTKVSLVRLRLYIIIGRRKLQQR